MKIKKKRIFVATAFTPFVLVLAKFDPRGEVLLTTTNPLRHFILDEVYHIQSIKVNSIVSNMYRTMIRV